MPLLTHVVDKRAHIRHARTYTNRYTEMLTDSAVFPVPALMTLALAILASPVFDAERVAHALVAARSCPALLAAAGSAHTHSVSATVNRAHL